MNSAWITDYERTSNNAYTVEWFVSPLEYSWGDGKTIADKIFVGPSIKSDTFDELVAPALYRSAMQAPFRAKMMVLAFMRETKSRSYALEIESGLIKLYALDFMSCVAQWIYVVEGYVRNLFQIQTNSNVQSKFWKLPETGNELHDEMIKIVCMALGRYLDKVIYRPMKNANTTTLNRQILLHGNLQNKAFYSQKNCLALMHVLDALVFIEMTSNRHFPQAFNSSPVEDERIARRTSVYLGELANSFTDHNSRKLEVLKEHLQSIN